ncbi:MAG: glycoside hydrolase family 3 C-terminal domain-containing protein [Rikenellaceae bacterium]|nr:glycoside hydrolase family 3 C-terminal domain-containing protein [Rikenellaceae bacterium]
MNRKLLLLPLAVAMVACCEKSVAPAIEKDAEIEAEIDKVLARMTLEEKVGQTAQLAIDVLGGWQDGEYVVDEGKLQEAVGKYKVGSFLNTPAMALSKENWQKVVTKIQEASLRELGIPTLYGLDEIHGTTYVSGGTMFPQPINIGASFNPELAYESAKITAYETRAANVPWTFSPTVDMARDPRWPRVWENYGEDVLVNSVMGSTSVRGYQGDDPNHIPADRMAVSVKHYMGYGVPRTGKDRTPAYISPLELREKFFEPFRACVEAGALTIMVNSASINGTPVHADHELLTVWLKDELGWDGMIVTDWNDINNLYIRERVAADKKEAIRIAINAGIDMAMEPYEVDYCTLLQELVEEGAVPMSRLDDAVRRVLRVKYRLNLFDVPNTSTEDYPLFASPEHAAVALLAAEESEVLLKNAGDILPLKQGVKMLVAGPNANSMRSLNGGWSYSWQGNLSPMFTEQYNTIYEALAAKFGAANVRLEQGVTYNEQGSYYDENPPEIARAVAAARGVDVIVACIGENSYCETPGNLSDLALSANQSALVKALAATGKPIVLILNGGRPRIIADIEPLASAVVNILLPGNYGGDALAGILAGEVNPSAKMPYTYPRYSAALTTYDYRVSEEADTMEGAYDYNAVVSVQWPFGFGLSYTTFEYSNLQSANASFGAGDELSFTVDVANTGARAGKEVVMLFSSDLVASVVPEGRRLRAFQKIELQAGETRTVELKIPASDLAFVGADGHWTLEAGDFRIQIGTQTTVVTCSETHRWPTPNR